MDSTDQKRIMSYFQMVWADKYQKQHNRSPQEAPLLLRNARKGL